MSTQLSDREFFYVYNKDLAKFLRYEKNIQYNCTGLNTKTYRQFWQFSNSETLYNATQEFKGILK